MKTLGLSLLFMLFTAKALEPYKPVDAGSSIQFKIKNFGIEVGGSFTGLQGTIKFDPANVGQSAFDVSVDANTVNTDNSMRDNHLRGDTYFDVKNYPRIHFVSTRISPSGKAGTYIVAGNLTIKNQTKSLSFPFTATTAGDGYIFKGTFTINRRDFGIGGLSIISDNLDVLLNVVAKK